MVLWTVLESEPVANNFEVMAVIPWKLASTVEGERLRAEELHVSQWGNRQILRL